MNDLETKIKQARKAGYNDAQIETFLKTKGLDSSVVSTVPKSNPAKEFAVGFGKGVGATAQGLQDIGQRTLAAIDPTKTLEEVREETGSKTLAEADFSAKTPYEKAGKTVEFVAEILFPVGKAGAFAKGEKILASGVDNLAEKASTLSDDLVEGGVKIKDRVIQLASKLDDKTKTALQRTTRDEFDEVVEVGRKAVTDDRAITPIERVGQKFVEGAQAVKNRLTKVGEQKRTVLSKAKNAQQDVSDLVKEAVLGIRKNLGDLGSEDLKYANEIIDRLMPYTKGGRLIKVDSLIDDIQDGLYKLSDSEKAVQLTDRVTGIIRGAVETMNKKLQTRVGGSYSQLNQQYSSLMRVLQDVNRGVGRKGERAGSFMKRFFSPSDAGTKGLFEQMQKLTGIDYAKEARLAKFIMESLGDKRAESLLEQVPELPRTSIETLMRAAEFLGKKLGITDPIEAAKVFIEKGGINPK